MINTGGVKIGAHYPVFIIAEAGSNWRMGQDDRDLAMACTLIEIAADAGCDAVKFQTYRSRKLYVANAGTSDYLAAAGIKKDINDILGDLEMPYAMLAKLKDFCDRKNILFMSTPFSICDADQVNPYVSIHKVASYELTHMPLIKHLADMGKPLILSTGASHLDNVAVVADMLKKSRTAFCLMQCTASYPAPYESLNLNVIATLRQRFKVPVGLSDHSAGPQLAPTAAVALGAKLIEKHFTVDRRLPGPDHAFAIEPDELKTMVRAIRNTELALGSGNKTILDEEIELSRFAIRGIQAIRNIEQGETLKIGSNIDVLRPGKQSLGAHPRFLGDIEGKRTRHAIKLGCGIDLKDCESR